MSQDKKIITKLAKKCEKNNAIDPALFKEFDVKRGLRNSDGSGVLAGLTQVSSVVGSKKVKDTVEPVEGVLRYRGIDLKDLVKGIKSEKRFGFEEVAYLLLFGELPTATELAEFTSEFNSQRNLPKDFTDQILQSYISKDIMNTLSRGVLALYAVDENPDSIDTANLVSKSISIIAKANIIIAYAYQVMKYQEGCSLVIRDPKPEYSTAENFLYLIREDGQFTDLEAKVLDVALVLHADHGGGNNSTFTTRVVSSSFTDSYSAIAAAVSSLKGPLHGGANNSVMAMMDDIKANVKDWTSEKEIKNYLLKIFQKKAGDGSGKVFGFGHAVYTKSDPRAVILKQFAKQLAKQKKRTEELDLYLLLEKLVPEVFYEFKGAGKLISPNVDFFSGFVYDCLGIPPVVYTPLFAAARVVGWMAHRIEEITISKRIIRPGYKSVRDTVSYVPTSKRS